MSSAASALLGLYCFTLPNTPPKLAANKRMSYREILGIDALSMLKDRGFCFSLLHQFYLYPLAFYYQHANQFLNEIGMKAAASKMVFGQISEVYSYFYFLFLLKDMELKMH